MANPWVVEYEDETEPRVTLSRYTYMPNEKQATQQFEEIVSRAESVKDIDTSFVLCNGYTIEDLVIYNLLRYRTKRLRNQQRHQATTTTTAPPRKINIFEYYAASSSSSSSCPSHPQEQASDP